MSVWHWSKTGGNKILYTPWHYLMVWYEAHWVTLLMIFSIEWFYKQVWKVVICVISHVFITYSQIMNLFHGNPCDKNGDPTLLLLDLVSIIREHYLVLWYQNSIPSSFFQSANALHSSSSHSFGITSARSISQLVPRAMRYAYANVTENVRFIIQKKNFEQFYLIKTIY